MKSVCVEGGRGREKERERERERGRRGEHHTALHVPLKDVLRTKLDCYSF